MQGTYSATEDACVAFFHVLSSSLLSMAQEIEPIFALHAVVEDPLGEQRIDIFEEGLTDLPISIDHELEGLKESLPADKGEPFLYLYLFLDCGLLQSHYYVPQALHLLHESICVKLWVQQ